MKTNIDTVREALVEKFHNSGWIAYDAANGDTEIFPSLEKAESWLYECSDEGIAEETEHGHSYIAKITHRSAMEIIDRKENYHQHNDDCTDSCDKETWPYDDEYDYVGSVHMVALSTIDPDAIRRECADKVREQAASKAVASFLIHIAKSGMATGNDHAVLAIADLIRAAVMEDKL